MRRSIYRETIPPSRVNAILIRVVLFKRLLIYSRDLNCWISSRRASPLLPSKKNTYYRQVHMVETQSETIPNIRASLLNKLTIYLSQTRPLITFIDSNQIDTINTVRCHWRMCVMGQIKVKIVQHIPPPKIYNNNKSNKHKTVELKVDTPLHISIIVSHKASEKLSTLPTSHEMNVVRVGESSDETHPPIRRYVHKWLKIQIEINGACLVRFRTKLSGESESMQKQTEWYNITETTTTTKKMKKRCNFIGSEQPKPSIVSKSASETIVRGEISRSICTAAAWWIDGFQLRLYNTIISSFTTVITRFPNIKNSPSASPSGNLRGCKQLY